MRGRKQDLQSKCAGSGPWRGRGWSPARSARSGHNFRGEKLWNGDEDPIGFLNLNRKWIKEDFTNQIKEHGLNI
jgi:hypothetical protein